MGLPPLQIGAGVVGRFLLEREGASAILSAEPTVIWDATSRRSCGCILSEMATGQALFPGDSEIDTIFKIFQVTISAETFVQPTEGTIAAMCL